MLVPDLPGHGASRPLPDDLGILTRRRSSRSSSARPDRVRPGVEPRRRRPSSSPTALPSVVLHLLGAMGVVEHELLGDPMPNAGLHALGVLAADAATWLLPHRGRRRPGGAARIHAQLRDTDQCLRSVLRTHPADPDPARGGDPLCRSLRPRSTRASFPTPSWRSGTTSHFPPSPDRARSRTTGADRSRRGRDRGESRGRHGGAPRRGHALPGPDDLPPVTGFALLLTGLLLALATLGARTRPASPQVYSSRTGDSAGSSRARLLRGDPRRGPAPVRSRPPARSPCGPGPSPSWMLSEVQPSKRALFEREAPA